jgi:hypothetical protein
LETPRDYDALRCTSSSFRLAPNRHHQEDF